MDKRQIFIHQAVVRRAHSEYVIAKNGVYASLLFVAMVITVTMLSLDRGEGIVLLIGIVISISMGHNLRKAEKKMKEAEKKLLALQTERQQEE